MEKDTPKDVDAEALQGGDDTAATVASSGNGDDSDVKERWNGWGAENKYFFLGADGVVSLSSTRATYPKFLPFLREVIPDWKPEKLPGVALEDVKLTAPKVNAPFVEAIRRLLQPNQISTDNEKRITHTYGKSHRDLLRLRAGVISRAPDMVLYPTSHEEVERIVALAQQHVVLLVPYGGGSNIVGAVEPTPGARKDLMVVTLDLKRMNKVLSIDRIGNTALIEAGALGPELESQLQKEGFSLGHDPDSFEYSTLGGWLATCSSGMQSDKYGDIEDMCVSLTLVTPTGTLNTPAVPRNGAGPSLKGLIVGSEGTLGIITKAVMKVHRLPEAKVFEGFLFPNFETGTAAIYSLVQAEALPSMVRLYDADETRLSFALKPPGSALQTFMSNAIKKYLEVFKSFNISDICLMITGTEGEKSSVAFKRSRLHRLLKAAGGFAVGTAPGETWYKKRYDLPYMRDFALDIGVWVDVTETSTSWSNILPLWRSVKASINNVFQKAGKPGWAGCHISHTYSTGCCLYFHFATVRGEKELQLYLAAKSAATDAILKHKGALSHHHGIGFEHIPWVRKYQDKQSIALLRAVKQHLDPKNICNPGKILPETDDGNETFLFHQLLDVPHSKL